jgi:hypothetical protein
MTLLLQAAHDGPLLWESRKYPPPPEFVNFISEPKPLIFRNMPDFRAKEIELISCGDRNSRSTGKTLPTPHLFPASALATSVLSTCG